MLQRTIRKHIRAMMLCFLCGVTLLSAAVAASANGRGESAWTEWPSLARLLRDPATPDLMAYPVEKVAEEEVNDQHRLTLRCDQNYTEIKAWVEADTNIIRLFRLSRNPASFGTDIIPTKKLSEAAVAFARRQFAFLWEIGDDVNVQSTSGSISDDGTVAFRLTPISGDIHLLPVLELGLGVDNGLVMSVQLIGELPEASVERPAAISREEAVAAAKAAAAGQDGERWLDSVPSRTTCGHEIRGGQEEFIWRISLLPPSGLHDSGRTTLAFVALQATDGEVVSAEIDSVENELIIAFRDAGEETSSAPSLPSRRTADTAPVWLDKEQILFQTLRLRAGRPLWRQQAPGIAVVNIDNGSMSMLDPAAIRPVLRFDVARDKPVLATVDSNNTGRLLDLETGVSSYFGSESRPVHDVALADDCSTVLFSANRRHGDADIFAGTVDSDLVTVTDQRRIALLEGYDHNPLFCQKERAVFFIHGMRNAEDDAVWRVSSAKVYWENEPPEQVCQAVGRIRSLSCFPTGNQLLIQDDRGLVSIATPGASQRVLPFPVLYDPEIPRGPELTIGSPAVSPDGSMLAFSAYRDAGDGKEGAGWYIYVCSLDGSDLRRVTPLKDDPVPPYIFPETGKTAFDVAREIALQRMDADR